MLLVTSIRELEIGDLPVVGPSLQGCCWQWPRGCCWQWPRGRVMALGSSARSGSRPRDLPRGHQWQLQASLPLSEGPGRSSSEKGGRCSLWPPLAPAQSHWQCGRGLSVPAKLHGAGWVCAGPLPVTVPVQAPLCRPGAAAAVERYIAKRRPMTSTELAIKPVGLFSIFTCAS